MEFKIHFSGRSHHYTQAEIETVVAAMKDADPLTQGKYRDAFEIKFSDYIGVKHCFTVCNATAALEMAAQLCQFSEGDEVIVPGHTFTSSLYPFLKKGARPVWADIDLETRVVTAETIHAKITKNTKAVIVVHLYGYMADMPDIMELAEAHDLLVIEDAAQSIGTDTNGKKSGSFGHLNVFSFHSHKNITTLGEGGMLVVSDPAMAEIIPLLRHNGHCGFSFSREDYWVPAMGNVDLPTLNGQPLWPNNFCLGEIECALGIKLLDRIDAINAEKRKRAIWFIDSLAAYEELDFHRVDTTRHNYHLLEARITNNKRDDFIRTMAHEKKIQCVVQYYPLYRYDYYRKAGYCEANCTHSDFYFDNMVSFPFHHWLSDSELEYMLRATRETLETLRKQ